MLIPLSVIAGASGLRSLLLLYMTLGAAARRNAKNDLIINTTKGRIRGLRHHLNDHQAVDCYLGIPFAKPPVGNLRFRHPEPIERWSNVRNATGPENSCYQLPDEVFGDFRGATMWNPPNLVSEDCLYLNIWVPRKHPRLRKSAVLVWIFGGGFTSGTPNLGVYDGKILAAENDIIVASIGYRVGVFGFLALGSPHAPGNAGLYDQLMGLDWIQQNIKYFGGDPTNVTLFGESAGSASVSLHLLSPLSHSKFQRAIMQSGTANMPWATYDMKEAKRRGYELATDYLGCPHSTDMDLIASCLRGTPPQELVEQQWVSRGIVQFPFVPVIDGSFLVEHPLDIMKRRGFKKCPVLLGSNLNEASFFLVYELTDFVGRDSFSMTWEQFIVSIDRLFYYYPQHPQELNEFGMRAIAYQYSSWLDKNDRHANYMNLDSAVGDSQFTCNVNEFAWHYANAGENVYSYYFTQPYSVNPWPEWMGVLHGDEIMFTFGQPLRREYNYTQAEKEFSRQLMTYWTNFAKTG